MVGQNVLESELSSELCSPKKMPTHRNFTYNFGRVLEPESPSTMPISYPQPEIREPKVKN